MIATDPPATLLAAAKAWDPALLWNGLYLAGALLLFALVVELFRRWRKRRQSHRLSASDQLAHFRSLYEDGTISAEEFESLKAVLGGEIRRAARVPAKPPPDRPPAEGAGRPPESSPGANDRPTPPPPETGIRPA